MNSQTAHSPRRVSYRRRSVEKATSMRGPAAIIGLVLFAICLIGFLIIICGPPPYRRVDDESPYKHREDLMKRHVPKPHH